jgi:hypothetical protein
MTLATPLVTSHGVMHGVSLDRLDRIHRNSTGTRQELDKARQARPRAQPLDSYSTAGSTAPVDGASTGLDMSRLRRGAVELVVEGLSRPCLSSLVEPVEFLSSMSRLTPCAWASSSCRALEKYTFEFYVGDCTKFEVLATTATDKACAIARLRQVKETRIERGFWTLGACPCGGKRS